MIIILNPVTRFIQQKEGLFIERLSEYDEHIQHRVLVGIRDAVGEN